MFEADFYCLVAAMFSSFVCLGSMSMFWFFELKEGYEWVADLVTFVWIAAGMTFVAWAKVWMAKPSFSSGWFLIYLRGTWGVRLISTYLACSMMSIILFIV